jgi:iron(III) transport system permease protein
LGTVDTRLAQPSIRAASLILSPSGFNTLASQVWSNINEAPFARAAAPTLLLILLSSVPLAWLTLQRTGEG